MTGPLHLEFDDFDGLRRLIRAHSGIWLGDSKISFLGVRVQERLDALNITSAREYYYLLKYDTPTDEMSRLIDAVTVNETWFFREVGPLQAWCGTVLAQMRPVASGLRIWSAGCSTGEEPYTVAMLLADSLAEKAAQPQIAGTDISHRALEAARAGVYDVYSLRHTEPRWIERYCQPAPGGRYAVIERIRCPVRFSWANLTDPALAYRMGGMDLILCRNVIIYFDTASRTAAMTNLYAALKPGGHLILGYSEMLAHVATPFEVVRVDGTTMYRKPHCG